MNPDWLLKHFEQISEAPDAIPRLRRFILDLAVRGKLVEQDPADEPASELLKWIEAEKARLAKAGSIRPSKPVEPIEENETPFAIPHSWKWIRLAGAGSVVGGGTPPSADPACFTTGGKGIAWLTPADLGKHSGLYILHGARDLTEKGFSSSSAQLMPTGSVLFTSRAPIGYTVIAANEITTNQGFKSVIPFILESNRYIATYFKAFATWIDGKASGTTFKEVSGKIVANLPFPLPPLAEQHRIVAKVDELMALCDELEAAQAKREKRRDRLVAATLHGLNNGGDSSEPGAHPTFEESARFYFNHLPRLTTRPEHIHQLRQTILNLAVRGRLVPQVPADEPASELMKGIEMDKAQLIKEGNIRKQKALPPIGQKDVPFDLPRNWEWVRLGDMCFTITDGSHHTPHYTEKGVPFLSVKDVSSGKIDLSNTRFISQESHNELCRRCKPESGDILLTKVGTTGIAVAVNRSTEFSIFVSIALLKFPASKILQPFLVHLLNSPFVRKQSAANTQGIGNKNLVLRLINLFVIPLPPLPEQHRIVAKVDKLMAMCDEVEARLTTMVATRRQLLEATLGEAIAS